jgi:uncharacterized membrane protein
MNFLTELPELILRWSHVMLGILWMGNSFFFNWMHANLKPPEKKREDVESELWMIHGGGLFHVEKRDLDPGDIPQPIHWFKWESYSTWISGILLLCVVYYFSGGIYLGGPSSTLPAWAQSGLGILALILGWGLYDLVWRSPLLRRNQPMAIALSLVFLLAMILLLQNIFLGRGAFMHIGALLGTLMAGNVFFHIIPSQHQMMSAVLNGNQADPRLATHASTRSLHNNYMSFPVIFLMIASHFPSAYTGEQSWMILLVLILSSALIRHFLNIRGSYPSWLQSAALTGFFALLIIATLLHNGSISQTGSIFMKWQALGTEWLNLLIRWSHVMIGILWIGNSFFFTWLIRSMRKPTRDDGARGEVWMLHGGGFYRVQSKELTPGNIPKVLHWFMWESYSTWITGFLLLIVVYYLSDGVFLLDPEVSSLTLPYAIVLSLATLIIGWLVYDNIWKSSLGQNQKGAIALCLLLLMLTTLILVSLLSARAAFIHVGVLLGTLMAANVFFHIIPSQRKMFASVKNGQEMDQKVSKHAKARSLQNHYMTFPVLFIMISNHFPGHYGHEWNWLILWVLILLSMGFKHLLNIPSQLRDWAGSNFCIGDDRHAMTGDMLVVGVLFLCAVASFVALSPSQSQRPMDLENTINYKQAQAILAFRCLSCHSTNPTDHSAPVPSGIFFDSRGEIEKLSARIQARAVLTRTMPPGNKTAMTLEERELLGQWIRNLNP